VAGASLELLAGLIDASLIHRQADGRYDLHDTLRQYAAEMLEEVPQEKKQVLESHSEYYLGYLAEMDPLLKDGGQVQALDWLDADMENLQSAWNWALANGRINLLHFAIPTFVLFFNMRSRFRGNQGDDRLCRPAAWRSSRIRSVRWKNDENAGDDPGCTGRHASQPGSGL